MRATHDECLKTDLPGKFGSLQAGASRLSVRRAYLFFSEPRLALVTPRLLSYIFLQKIKTRTGRAGAAARNERSIQEKGLDP